MSLQEETSHIIYRRLYVAFYQKSLGDYSCAIHAERLALLVEYFNAAARWDIRSPFVMWQATRLFYHLLTPQSFDQPIEQVFKTLSISYKRYEKSDYHRDFFELIQKIKQENFSGNLPKRTDTYSYINEHGYGASLLNEKKESVFMNVPDRAWHWQRYESQRGDFRGFEPRLQLSRFSANLPFFANVFDASAISENLSTIFYDNPARVEAIVKLLQYIETRVHEHKRSSVRACFFEVGKLRKSGEHHIRLATLLVDRLLFDSDPDVAKLMRRFSSKKILTAKGGSTGRLGKLLLEFSQEQEGLSQRCRPPDDQRSQALTQVLDLLKPYFQLNPEAKCYIASHSEQKNAKLYASF